MVAEMDLHRLLSNLNPELNPGKYVFCTLESSIEPPELEPLGWFREAEGISVILSRQQAKEYGYATLPSFAWITLKVNSSLEAVGLIAAVSAALANAGIACNVVAATHHDHLFVPWDQAQQAVALLKSLAA